MVDLIVAVRGVRITLSVVLILTIGTGCRTGKPAPDPVVIKRAQLHMGTLVAVTAVASTEDAANIAINAGFAEVKRLEQLLSTWIPTSELSRVNAFAGRTPVHVGPDTFAVIQRSLEVAEMTDGAFNIAIGPAVDAWNVTEQQSIPAAQELEDLKVRVDLRDVRADARSQTIFLEKAGMRIDIGGIGKGYAADQAVIAMKRAGAVAGVVALSGDIKTFGQLPGGKRFPVGIRHPRREQEVLAFIDLQDEAISTAGDYERFFERDGVRYHHILDPATLQPARGCQSVTVVAKEGIWADGLDTGIFVMGLERGMELVEHLDNVEAIIVDREGQVHISSGLRSRVRVPSTTEEKGYP